MTKLSNQKKKRKKRLRNILVLIVILLLFIGIPALFLNYQASKSNMTISEVIQRRLIRSNEGAAQLADADASELVGEKIDFLLHQHVGNEFAETPMISNVLPTDLDDDQLLDIIVCDAKDNFVSWIRQYPAGVYTEHILATDLIAPAHAEAFDFDMDGDKDILVAVLGLLYPSNDKIGSVVLLELVGNSPVLQQRQNLSESGWRKSCRQESVSTSRVLTRNCTDFVSSARSFVISWSFIVLFFRKKAWLPAFDS